MVDFKIPLQLATLGVTFTCDGNGVLFCSPLGKITELDVITGKESQTYELGANTYDMNTTRVYNIVLSPKGDRLLTGCSDGNARLYSFPECKELKRFRGYGRVQFSPDGKTALTLAKNGRIMLWDLEK